MASAWRDTESSLWKVSRWFSDENPGVCVCVLLFLSPKWIFLLLTRISFYQRILVFRGFWILNFWPIFLFAIPLLNSMIAKFVWLIELVLWLNGGPKCYKRFRLRVWQRKCFPRGQYGRGVIWMAHTHCVNVVKQTFPCKCQKLFLFTKKCKRMTGDVWDVCFHLFLPGNFSSIS